MAHNDNAERLVSKDNMISMLWALNLVNAFALNMDPGHTA